MDDIRKVVAYNLKKYRGERTQAQLAELLDIPFRTYQNMESGDAIPQPANLARAAEFYRVSETVFFQDPDIAPLSSPTIPWRELLATLSTLDDTQIEGVLTAVRAAQGATTPRAKRARTASGES